MKSFKFIFFSLIIMACSHRQKSNTLDLTLAIDSMAVKAGVNNIKTDNQQAKREISFCKIDHLDIMNEDLGIMNVVQAEEEALKIGDGWRLPNEMELNLIYESDSIKNLATNYYVGVEESVEIAEDGSKEKIYLRKSVVNGELITLQTKDEIYSIYGARLVRDHH